MTWFHDHHMNILWQDLFSSSPPVLQAGNYVAVSEKLLIFRGMGRIKEIRGLDNITNQTEFLCKCVSIWFLWILRYQVADETSPDRDLNNATSVLEVGDHYAMIWGDWPKVCRNQCLVIIIFNNNPHSSMPWMCCMEVHSVAITMTTTQRQMAANLWHEAKY